MSLRLSAPAIHLCAETPIHRLLWIANLAKRTTPTWHLESTALRRLFGGVRRTKFFLKFSSQPPSSRTETRPNERVH